MIDVFKWKNIVSSVLYPNPSTKLSDDMNNKGSSNASCINWFTYMFNFCSLIYPNPGKDMFLFNKSFYT